MTNTNPLSARRNQYGQFVTPQAFGAAGDGVTNDTAAWAAFQAAPGLKAVPAGRYLVGGATKRFDKGCLGNGEFIDTPGAWTQPMGDRERHNIITNRNEIDANVDLVSPQIKTQTHVDFRRSSASGSFKHVVGAYHEGVYDGYYNTREDTNQNFTVVGSTVLNRMAGLFGSLAYMGRAATGTEEDNPGILTMGAPKQGVMFAETRHNTKHENGGYSFNYEGYLINLADETAAIPYQNNDEYSFLPWTTNAKFTGGGNSPISSAILMHGLGGRHGYWNGIVLGASMWRIDDEIDGPAGTVAINMASQRASRGFADIGLKFRTNNRHLHFVEGAKIRSIHTRFMNDAGGTGISIEGKTGNTQYLNFRNGATAAAEGGSVVNTAQILSTVTQMTLNVPNGEIILSPSGEASFRANSARFAPVGDNEMALGSSSARFTTVYAATGSINTSDARAKTDVRDITDQELAVALRIKGLLKAYRFKDAVAQKGDKARIHFGVIAQDVVAAFAAEGLDAHDYALLCHDTWEASPERVEVVRTEVKPAVYAQILVRDAVYNQAEDGHSIMETEAVYEDGDLISEAVIEETRHVIPAVEAGERYGIRYDELTAFVLASL